MMAKKIGLKTAGFMALLLGSSAGLAQVACSEAAQGAQVTYWNGFSGPDGQFMADLVDRFNAENESGVQVTMTVQPFTEYYNTLNAAVASNTLPDVLQIHLDQIATSAVRGLIRPISEDVLSDMGIDASDFPEAVWQGTEYNGERYSIPIDIQPLVMWYNRAQWEAAGVEDPAGQVLTREEYDAALAALQESNGEAMAWSITNGFPIGWMFETLLYQFGGSRFNEDGTEATWNSEAGVQALQYLKDQQTAYSQANLEVDAGITAFKQGNSSTEWNGPWQVSNLTGEGFQDGWGAPLPNVGGEYIVTAGAHTLALAQHRSGEDDAKTAAAACLISFISENSLEWVQGAGHIPARNSVLESEEFQALEPQASYASMADSAVFLPSVPGITDALALLGQAVESVMAEANPDIQAALNEAAQRANQALEQNRQRYGGQ
jgi:multiple sugar transport system substrate-binding protein